MGRKGNYAERVKKGPGRKAKKQGEPTFGQKLLKVNERSKPFSHRQKQRIAKREKVKIVQAAKIETTKVTKQVAKTKGFSDDNQEWLKLKQGKMGSGGESDDEEDEAESDAENESGSDSDGVMQDDFSGNASNDDEEEEEEDDEANGEVEAASDDDSDDVASDDDDESEEEAGSDDDDLLPIERENKKLKKKQAKEDKFAEEELKSQQADKEQFEFPEEEEEEGTKVVSLQDVQMRIKDVAAVLGDFEKLRDPNRSRSDYLELLKKDLCIYYTYNEFMMETFMDLFSINELLEFLEASEVSRPLTIRTNSLKTRRRDLAAALINRGVNLDPIGKWSKVGLVIYSAQVPLGATPEYLAGHYMIQGGSSMLPVMALAPQENERILDMCSAPGGKSSHIAAIMKNTGVLFANDVNQDRLNAVIGNFHRLGIVNSVITCIDGVQYKQYMSGFDRVLLDAPCTGTGVIAKDPSVKTSKTQVDIQRCFNLQRKLILSAIDCLSAKSATGGILVYSTCSVLPEENEWVIDYALKKRNVKLISTGLDFGTEGLVNYKGQRYHPSMKLTRRFYPHSHNMDGFFVAKLQKFSDAIPGNAKKDAEEEIEDDEDIVLPKKIDKRDWYNKELLDKTKKKKPDDKNHVVTVFQKPENVKRKRKNKEKKQQPEENKSSAKQSTAVELPVKKSFPEVQQKSTSKVQERKKKEISDSDEDVEVLAPKQKKYKGTPKGKPQRKGQMNRSYGGTQKSGKFNGSARRKSMQ